MADVLDPKVTRWVFPFATTFLIFIVLCNYVDLIPGVGSIGYGVADKASSLPFAVSEIGKPFFRPPTSDANLTFAMASIFFVMSLFWAVRYNGVLGFAKHVFGVKMQVNKWVYPVIALLFLFIGAMEVVSIMFARPVALAMRLYGNVFAGESILDMIFHGKSLFWSILLSSGMYFYETFVCIVQAFVFAMLVVAFEVQVGFRAVGVEAGMFGVALVRAAQHVEERRARIEPHLEDVGALGVVRRVFGTEDLLDRHAAPGLDAALLDALRHGFAQGSRVLEAVTRAG